MPDAAKSDGLSVLRLLSGGAARNRDDFDGEPHEAASLQAVRFGDMKAVKNSPRASTELYNLKADPAEKADLAAKNPEVVEGGVTDDRGATGHPDYDSATSRNRRKSS